VADAVHVTDRDESSGVTTMPVGAEGGATGVDVTDGDDVLEVPEALVDRTVNEYLVPFVNPVTTYEFVVVAARNVPLR
jgi:hypothetical protein